jgi:hypothetical protein
MGEGQSRLDLFIDRMVSQRACLDHAIAEQNDALASYSDLETWQKQIWSKISVKEKKDFTDKVFGKEIPLESLAYHYSDM